MGADTPNGFQWQEFMIWRKLRKCVGLFAFSLLFECWKFTLFFVCALFVFVFVVVIRNKVIYITKHMKARRSNKHEYGKFSRALPKNMDQLGRIVNKKSAHVNASLHIYRIHASPHRSIVWSEALFAAAARKVAENSKLNLVSSLYRYSPLFFPLHSCWNQFFPSISTLPSWKTKMPSQVYSVVHWIENVADWIKWWTDFIWKSSRFLPLFFVLPIYSPLWTSAIVTCHCPIHFQV